MDIPEWDLRALNEKLDHVAAVKDINDSTLLTQSQALAELSRQIEKANAIVGVLREQLDREKHRVVSYNQRKQKEMEESMALLTGKPEKVEKIEIKEDVLEPLESTKLPRSQSAWTTVVKKEAKIAVEHPITNGIDKPVAVEYKFKETTLSLRVFMISDPAEAAHPSRRGYLCWTESQNRFWFWLSGQLMQCQPPQYVHQGQKYKMLDFDLSYLRTSEHPDATNYYRNPLDFPDSTDIRGYYNSVQIVAASRAGTRNNQYAMPVGDLSTASEDMTRASTPSLRRQADWGTCQMLMSLLINQELTQRARTSK